MNLLLRILFTCFLLSYFSICYSQNQKDTAKVKPAKNLAKMVVIDGDTLYDVILNDATVTASSKDYWNKYFYYKRRVEKVYPYALMINELVKEIDEDLEEQKRRRDKKKVLKSNKEELHTRFEKMVKEMTESEGKVFVKLIYRETGLTAYEIIEKYQGSVKAMMWQTASRLGGANLKLKYQPETESNDKVVETIVQEIHQCKIKIKKIPLHEEAPKTKATAKK